MADQVVRAERALPLGGVGEFQYQVRARDTAVELSALDRLAVFSRSGRGVRGVNRDRIARGEGHFERLVETRVEVPFGVGFLGHAARIECVR